MCRVIRVALFTATVASLCFAQTYPVPDAGWRVVPDPDAEWRDDELHLPGEFTLDELPVNAPTMGWDALATAGVEATLPTTVEEFFWGEFGFRDYTDMEYTGATWFGVPDTQVQNGAYRGVSWFYRNVNVSDAFEGKRVELIVRAARLRAEVYLNRKLIGYNIINGVSFVCDASEAIRPGETNELAIRITNPGGRLDWLDVQLMSWGDAEFHNSHGFGGVDRGLAWRVSPFTFIDDFHVLNGPEPRDLRFSAEIRNDTDERAEGTIRFVVNDGGDELFGVESLFTVEPGGRTTVIERATAADVELWTLSNPRLYQARAVMDLAGGASDARERRIGFRSFDVAGIGQDATLRHNGERVRLTTAISWGFWGFNGLYPRPDLAIKEVVAAKTFGMNCLNFHRQLGRAEVFDAQDSLGLFRILEPGGGQTALGKEFTFYAPSPDEPIDVSGADAEPTTFAEKYMEEKILRMIRDSRSRPSLVAYNIQNEINPDLRNPRIFNLIRKMREADPSRMITLKSGIPPHNQVRFAPWDTTLRYDAGDGDAGVWDKHTVGGPGVWRDEMYLSPENYTHRGEIMDEILIWGEMLGAATPDNHFERVAQIEAEGGASYDIRDSREILAAYDAFLDRWGFRDAFPTTGDLFRDLANKGYDFWGRVLETARLSDLNDALILNGWESTAIENHSGLLDNLRNFKGDPELIASRMAPLSPVVKPRALVVRANDEILFDLFLLNETHEPIEGNLVASIVDPDGEETTLGVYPAPRHEEGIFAYLVARGLRHQTAEPGYYTIQAKATDANVVAIDSVLALDTRPSDAAPDRVGVISSPEILDGLREAYPSVEFEPFDPASDYETIFATARVKRGNSSMVNSNMEIHDTDDDPLFHTESWGYSKNLEFNFTHLPPGEATVTLRFAEVTLQGPGARVFDVAINGELFLDDFDVTEAAGGDRAAIDTSFVVNAPRRLRLDHHPPNAK